MLFSKYEIIRHEHLPVHCQARVILRFVDQNVKAPEG